MTRDDGFVRSGQAGNPRAGSDESAVPGFVRSGQGGIPRAGSDESAVPGFVRSGQVEPPRWVGRIRRGRPRRLRTTPAMRRLVGETSVLPRQLVLPMFVMDDSPDPRPITSMPGVVQHTRDSLRKAAVEAVEAGVGGLMLFGVPTVGSRDAVGSGATDPDGLLNVAIRDVVSEVGDATVVMADLCLDEFTDHGHCGVLAPDGSVDNDATLLRYAEMAAVQAEAGVHVVGPSGMMDGQVRAIRAALDGSGHLDVAILAYAVEVRIVVLRPLPRGCGLYAARRPPDLPAGPRQPAGGPSRGIARPRPRARTSSWSSRHSATSTCSADVAAISDVPVAAYNVSGEYSMVEAAAAAGYLDRRGRHPRDTHLDPAGRCRRHPHLLGRRSSPTAVPLSRPAGPTPHSSAVPRVISAGRPQTNPRREARFGACRSLPLSYRRSRTARWRWSTSPRRSRPRPRS